MPISNARVLTLLCIMLLVPASLASLAMGDTPLSYSQVVQALNDSTDSTDSFEAFIVQELRLPRLVTGLLAGAALGMAGALVQAITRNPLGTPDLMGVSAGASFAIVLGFVLLGLSPASLLALGTLGGFIAGLLTFAIAWKTHLNPIHLTLSGMSIALFFTAGITILLISADADANGIYYWLAGSLMNRTWQHVEQLYPFVGIGLILGILFSRPLNLLMLDDITSRSLGLPVQRWRLLLGFTAVVLTAATVAVAGPISFIGLVAPHIVKLALKLKSLPDQTMQPEAQALKPIQPHKQTQDHKQTLDHKIILPLSALTGATLVCLADWGAKFQEVPVGILCILLGGPLFVYLIRKQDAL